MFRKLLILGAIAALFTIVAVAPASAIAIDKGGPNGPTSVIVLQYGPQGDGSNNAHGPSCGNEDFTGLDGCLSHSSPDAAVDATRVVAGMKNPFGTVLGAWNAVFQSSEDSAICGIWATVDEAEEGLEGLACDYVPAP